ncbi:hypothetical protein, conserved [Eimeria praecox]|uniref:Uncharacterized protein n=1 Tax=Eimeria praecox TaxID=51316 RepID=U6GUT2_9EIME|nr:hypothetical protein, conserved [Eimeria praecox]
MRYYRDKTLKLSLEAPASSLFAEGALKKFEASDVVSTGNSLYFVSDSSFSLMKAGYRLTPLSPENQLIGQSERNGNSESDWEALWLDEQSGVFYIVREAVTHNPDQEEAEAPAETEQQRRQQQEEQQERERSSTKPFHAHIEEITISGDTYNLQTTGLWACETTKARCISLVGS